MADKPRYRVPAGGSRKAFVGDSFQDFTHSLGYGTSGPLSSATYGFNPISRNHVLLEWMYRGSWLTRRVVDSIADDMTRAGIEFDSTAPPDRIEKFHKLQQNLQVWQRLNQTIKWARLYGGCLAVMMIDGQKYDQPLNVDTIKKGQFRGLLVLDRWMLWPQLDRMVTDPGVYYGTPEYYEVISDARTLPSWRIHYSRVVRIDGDELPYWQRIAENYWGLSVIEPLWDRMIAFDSATTGAAQLVYRAHLRTYYVEQLRELISAGGPMYQAFMQQIQLIRQMQANESMTILDASDKFETHQYAFSGLSDILVQLAQQISGACQIPLTRLFGQSPAGMNATGESDMRNYYDSINAHQEARLRIPLTILFDVMWRSLYGEPMPEDTSFHFKSLWQMDDQQKSQVAASISGSVVQAYTEGIIGRKTALQELRQSSRVTGIYSNITDEQIADAEEDPPAPEEAPPMPGEEGAEAGQPGIPGTPEQAGNDDQSPHAQRVAEIAAGSAGKGTTSPSAPGEDDAAETREQLESPVAAARQGSTPPQMRTHNALRSLAINKPDEQSPPPANYPGVESTGNMRIKTVRRIATQKPKASNAERVAAIAAGTVNPRRRVHTPQPVVRRTDTASQPNYAARVAAIANKDRLSMIDVNGIVVVVETDKGERREGAGWSVTMPCIYGYIGATSSAEGPFEQMDAFVGPNDTSPHVFMVEQLNPGDGSFDEHKIMLGYNDEASAIADYRASYSDHALRMGKVTHMSIPQLNRWLQAWKYGQTPDAGNGKAWK